MLEFGGCAGLPFSSNVRCSGAESKRISLNLMIVAVIRPIIGLGNAICGMRNACDMRWRRDTPLEQYLYRFLTSI